MRRRRHALLRSEAGPRVAGTGSEARRRCRPRSSGWKACSPKPRRSSPTGSAPGRPRSATAERAWTVLTPRDGHGDQRRPADARSRTGRCWRRAPNPELTTYTVTLETTARASPGCGSRRCPIRACRAAARAATPTATSASPAWPCRSRRVAGGPEAPLDVATMQVDDAAAAFEPMDLLVAAGPGGGRGRRAWGINALRETVRLPRHAVLEGGASVRLSGRHARDAAHRAGGRRHRTGRRPLPAGGHQRRRSADRRDRSRGAAAAGPARPQPTVAEDGAKELATHFRQTTPSLKATRDALQRGSQGADRPAAPDARW